jgi:predicted DNA-binding protein (MmcQ/YjbR family)
MDGYDVRVLAEKTILSKLREICLSLPKTVETVTFGHPTFQVHGKTSAVLEGYQGEPGICLKVGTLLQGGFLDDSRFFRTPYKGDHGWVTLRVCAAPLNWREIRGLAKGSYDLGAPKTPQKNRG